MRMQSTTYTSLPLVRNATDASPFAPVDATSRDVCRLPAQRPPNLTERQSDPDPAFRRKDACSVGQHALFKLPGDAFCLVYNPTLHMDVMAGLAANCRDLRLPFATAKHRHRQANLLSDDVVASPCRSTLLAFADRQTKWSSRSHLHCRGGPSDYCTRCHHHRQRAVPAISPMSHGNTGFIDPPIQY